MWKLSPTSTQNAHAMSVKSFQPSTTSERLQSDEVRRTCGGCAIGDVAHSSTRMMSSMTQAGHGLDIDHAIHWKRMSERLWERVWTSVSVTCRTRTQTCMHENVWRWAEHMWTCRWISWVREWIGCASANAIECECECVSVRVMSLAGLLQRRGLPTLRAALSCGGWYCKCWMPDD